MVESVSFGGLYFVKFDYFGGAEFDDFDVAEGVQWARWAVAGFDWFFLLFIGLEVAPELGKGLAFDFAVFLSHGGFLRFGKGYSFVDEDAVVDD